MSYLCNFLMLSFALAAGFAHAAGIPLKFAPGWEIERLQEAPAEAAGTSSRKWFQLIPPHGQHPVDIDEEMLEMATAGEISVEDLYQWRRTGKMPPPKRDTPRPQLAEDQSDKKNPQEDFSYEMGRPLLPAQLVWSPSFKGRSPAEALPSKTKNCTKEEAAPLKFPQISPSDRNHFSILRLDPGNLTTNVKGWVAGAAPFGVFKADIQKMLQTYQKLGVKKILISRTVNQSEQGDFFFYRPSSDPKLTFTYRSLNKDNEDVRPVLPQRYQGGLRGGDDFLIALLDAAAASGIQVFLGLSTLGDPNLLAEYRTLAADPQEATKLESRLQTALAATEAQAKDLYAQFGKHPAFAGWLLNSSGDCINGNLKFQQRLATALKKLSAQKQIVASGEGNATTCEKGESSTELLTKAGKTIDALLYSDNFGQVAQAKDPVSQTICNGAENCESILLAKNSALLEKLKKEHTTAGIALWWEAQAWRESERCELVSNRPWCNVASWSSLDKQLKAAAKRLGSSELVLSEGYLALETLVENASANNPNTQTRTAELTKGYVNYLWPQLAGDSCEKATRGLASVSKAGSNINLGPEVDENKSQCLVFPTEVSASASTSHPSVTEIIPPSIRFPSAWDAGLKRCPELAQEVADNHCQQNRSLQSVTVHGTLRMAEGKEVKKQDFTIEKNCAPSQAK